MLDRAFAFTRRSLLLAGALSLGLGSLGLGSLGFGMTSGAWAQETTLRMANWLPPTHPLMKDVMVPYAKSIEEATDGRVAIQILDAPLGPPPAHYEFAVNGVADITYGVHGYTPGRFKATQAAEVPFLGDSAEATSVGYWRTHEKLLSKADEHKDVKLLGVFTHGPGEIFLRGREVGDENVMTGAKMRVGGGIVSDVATALGATPVQAPSSKAYELLSGGVADGILFPFESVSFFKLDGVVDRGLTVPGGLYNTSFFVVMNRAKWDALSDADKAAIDKVSGEALARLAGQAWDAADKAGRDAMAGKVEITEASDAQMKAFESKLAPVVDKAAATISETGIDGQEAIAMMRAETEAAASQ